MGFNFCQSTETVEIAIPVNPNISVQDITDAITSNWRVLHLLYIGRKTMPHHEVDIFNITRIQNVTTVDYGQITA